MFLKCISFGRTVEPGSEDLIDHGSFKDGAFHAITSDSHRLLPVVLRECDEVLTSKRGRGKVSWNSNNFSHSSEVHRDGEIIYVPDNPPRLTNQQPTVDVFS
ncbi:hypothetical protein NE237_029310 [Protea cynaroides]|uniref:Uncharacterized protein n=1 Tax=Protea cynaroides TaxID=273540 RepID=A0A9Q0GTN9_9MAGN|nr:hypothetical protein NE237_029310 [Protea cynaroides]